MLNIEVLCVGKVNADYFAAGCAEFVKRAGGLANVRVTELPEETIREKNAGEATIRKALEKDAALVVFLARNADPAITGPIEAKCIAHQVSCAWVASMADLGKACGIDVGAAAAAAVK